MTEEQVKELLKRALPRVGEVEPERDLWPAMLRRMSAPHTGPEAKIPWFDWVLLAGLAGFAALVPTSIPVILYYL